MKREIGACVNPNSAASAHHSSAFIPITSDKRLIPVTHPKSRTTPPSSAASRIASRPPGANLPPQHTRYPNCAATVRSQTSTSAPLDVQSILGGNRTNNEHTRCLDAARGRPRKCRQLHHWQEHKTSESDTAISTARAASPGSILQERASQMRNGNRRYFFASLSALAPSPPTPQSPVPNISRKK